MGKEQWKEQGDCSKCRKKDYCGTECKAHRLRTRKYINNLITQKMDEKTNGVYSKIMNNLSKGAGRWMMKFIAIATMTLEMKPLIVRIIWNAKNVHTITMMMIENRFF